MARMVRHVSVLWLTLLLQFSASVHSQNANAIEASWFTYKVTDFQFIQIAVQPVPKLLLPHPKGSLLYVDVTKASVLYSCGPVIIDWPNCSIETAIGAEQFSISYRIEFNRSTSFVSAIVDVLNMTAYLILSPPNITYLEASSSTLNVTFCLKDLSLLGEAANLRLVRISLVCIDSSCPFREKRFEQNSSIAHFSYDELEPAKQWRLEIWNTFPGSIYDENSPRESREFNTTKGPFRIADHKMAIVIGMLMLAGVAVPVGIMVRSAVSSALLGLRLALKREKEDNEQQLVDFRDHSATEAPARRVTFDT